MGIAILLTIAFFLFWQHGGLGVLYSDPTNGLAILHHVLAFEYELFLQLNSSWSSSSSSLASSSKSMEGLELPSLSIRTIGIVPIASIQDGVGDLEWQHITLLWHSQTKNNTFMNLIGGTTSTIICIMKGFCVVG